MKLNILPIILATALVVGNIVAFGIPWYHRYNDVKVITKVVNSSSPTKVVTKSVKWTCKDIKAYRDKYKDYPYDVVKWYEQNANPPLTKPQIAYIDNCLKK